MMDVNERDQILNRYKVALEKIHEWDKLEIELQDNITRIFHVEHRDLTDKEKKKIDDLEDEYDELIDELENARREYLEFIKSS